MQYLKEFGDIYKRLEKRLEPVVVNQEQWKRDKTYLWHEDRIVVPSNRTPALPKWTHESSGHVGANRTLRRFKQWFHSTGRMTSCGKPSSLSWTSARVGPVNLGISVTEVSILHSLSPTVPTVFSTWTTQRCLSSGAMTLP